MMDKIIDVVFELADTLIPGIAILGFLIYFLGY